MSKLSQRIGLVLMIVVVAVTGCATIPSTRGAAIQDADQKSVETCKFVRNVSGTSGWGIDDAKNAAREQAAQSGATHIVWFSIGVGVSGNAYKCE